MVERHGFVAGEAFEAFGVLRVEAVADIGRNGDQRDVGDENGNEQDQGENQCAQNHAEVVV